MSIDFFEDNWRDVIEKARRGLNLTLPEIARSSRHSLTAVEQLFKGCLDKKTLVAIAPSLSLNAKALLRLAENIAPSAVSLPSQLLQLTTFFEGMQVHSYLLWSEENKRAVVFDTGSEVKWLLKKLATAKLTLEALFLTHNHRDHVEKLSELLAQTHAQAWIAAADSISGAQLLPEYFSYQLDQKIHIEARSTPGHSPGGTTYLIQGLPVTVAIVGDALFARSMGGVAASAYQEALKSIKQNILSLPPTTILCPGHGPLTTVDKEKKENPFFVT